MKNSFKSIAAAVCLTALIGAGCAARENSRSTGTFVDDTTVSTKIKAELLADKNVKGTDVSVRTYNGEVQLSGFVDNSDQKIRAEQIARAVPGVRDVHDDLIVKTSPTAQVPVNEAAGAQTPPPVASQSANQ
jgi:osmotically-inducible protein OsmY